MPILGITGGVATGKSTFARLLLGQFAAAFFDADQCARELLDADVEVRQMVREAFGEGIFIAGDGLDRKALGSIVFASTERRHTLEKILHPRIRARWLPLTEVARAAGEWLVVDIPLLFETASAALFDEIVVVGCGKLTQMSRLLVSRKMSPQIAEQMIASQMDLDVKITKGNRLIWNDGSRAALEEQTVLLAGLLKQRHG